MFVKDASILLFTNQRKTRTVMAYIHSGHLLKVWSKRKGFTMSQIAEHFNVTYQTIQYDFNGFFQPKKLQLYCDELFGITMSDFFNLDLLTEQERAYVLVPKMPEMRRGSGVEREKKEKNNSKKNKHTAHS